LNLIDSTVAIDHLRGREEASDLLDACIASGEAVAASEIVRFELLAGVHADEEAALEEFFSVLSWVAVNESVSRAAGDLARKFRASHSGIDDADYVIAATALILDARLLTTNVRHFPMLTGLEPAY
jgi:predicted nucleic acid-binding protein